MRFALCISTALTLSYLASAAEAVELKTSYTSLSGSSWKVDLTLINNDAAFVSATNPTGAISEFTVFFPYATSSSLATLSTPVAWDPLVIQPDSSPSDGYVDYLVNSGYPALSVGGTATGFSIAFTWSERVAPGALSYAVVDPGNFATLYAGTTTNAVAAIPEPTTAVLALVGLAALAWRSRGGSKPAERCVVAVEAA